MAKLGSQRRYTYITVACSTVAHALFYRALPPHTNANALPISSIDSGVMQWVVSCLLLYETSLKPTAPHQI
eukprot:scaffold253420_cov22-Tisochrysis_lutea.AAC.1